MHLNYEGLMIGVKCQLIIIIIVLFNLNLQCSQSK